MKLKKIIIGSLLALCLFGCPVRPKYPIYLVSLNSNNLFRKSFFCRPTDNKICKDKIVKIDYGNVGNMIGYGMTHITFYYKSESCPIYSYTQDQLLQMKRDAGYNDNSFDGVFLVDLQGLHFVSNKEFKNLKVNSKFDEIDEKKICKSKNKIKKF
jgi:hypothetical protein